VEAEVQDARLDYDRSQRDVEEAEAALRDALEKRLPKEKRLKDAYVMAAAFALEKEEAARVGDGLTSTDRILSKQETEL
jgi:hypothetical protein